MVRYVSKTVYNSVLGIIILLGEDVTNAVCGLGRFCLHLDTKFVIMPDWPFLGYILYDVFGEGSNSVHLS